MQIKETLYRGHRPVTAQLRINTQSTHPHTSRQAQQTFTPMRKSWVSTYKCMTYGQDHPTRALIMDRHYEKTESE